MELIYLGYTRDRSMKFAHSNALCPWTVSQHCLVPTHPSTDHTRILRAIHAGAGWGWDRDCMVTVVYGF